MENDDNVMISESIPTTLTNEVWNVVRHLRKYMQQDSTWIKEHWLALILVWADIIIFNIELKRARTLCSYLKIEKDYRSNEHNTNGYHSTWKSNTSPQVLVVKYSFAASWGWRFKKDKSNKPCLFIMGLVI